MTHRIVLPTDGEPGTEEAIELTIELAEKLDATIHALYVVDETIYGAYDGDEFVQEHEGPQATLEAKGREALADIEAKAEPVDVPVETAMRYGRPVEEILAEAEAIDADSIVLGSRTEPDASHSRVGSVADEVVRRTDRSVTVVKTSVTAE